MKFCLQPWTQLHVHIKGNVWFCCMKPSKTQKIDFKNIDQANFKERINCEEVVNLRQAFLSGEVPRFCKGCMMLHEYKDVEDFKDSLIKEGAILDTSDDIKGLSLIGGIKQLFFEFTTKCNFKCIYCLHSTNAFKNRIDSIDVENFYNMFRKIKEELKISELSTTGIGEFTIIPNWTEIINSLLRNYPSIKITMFSNLGKVMSDYEIETLSKLNNINVSIDTNKKELFKALRSGDVDIVINNLRRLRAFIDKNNTNTKITVASVVNDKMFIQIEEFLEFLISENICNEITLTPMTLPKVACNMLDIYPIKAEKGTVEFNKIRDTLKSVYEKGRNHDIRITWSGDLQDYYSPI